MESSSACFQQYSRRCLSCGVFCNCLTLYVIYFGFESEAVSGLINTERRWGKPLSVWLPGTVSFGSCSICKTCSHKKWNQTLQFLNGMSENYLQANKSCVRPCKKPPSFGVWFCLAEIIFTPEFGSVDCVLLQTLVNPLHTLESWSSNLTQLSPSADGNMIFYAYECIQLLVCV